MVIIAGVEGDARSRSKLFQIPHAHPPGAVQAFDIFTSHAIPSLDK